MYWLWYILIGLAAGYVASLIVKGSGSGMLLNLVIGMVGGVLGPSHSCNPSLVCGDGIFV